MSWERCSGRLRYHSFRILSRIVTCFSVSLEEQVPELVVGKDRTTYTTLMIELRIPAREDNEYKVKGKKQDIQSWTNLLKHETRRPETEEANCPSKL